MTLKFVTKESVYGRPYTKEEEADFYRIQLKSPPDQYEICELTADGRVIALGVP